MNEILTYLKPSTVCDGVGVFAMKFIPKNTRLFAGVKSDTKFIKWDDVSYLSKDSLNYLNSLCNSNKEGFFLSRHPDEICTAYYVNHSENFNVFHDLSLDKYVTSRDIEVGEELLCKYTKDEIDW